MKSFKSILTVCFLISSNLGISQDAKLDSTQYYKWFNEEWNKLRVTDFIYPSEEEHETTTYNVDLENIYTPSNKNELSYNGNGDLMSICRFTYDADSGFLPFSKTAYEYNSQNQQSAIISTLYDQDIEDFKKLQRHEYFDFDENGRSQRTDIYINDGNNEWIFNREEQREYFYTNQLLDSLTTFNVESGQLEIKNSQSYSYNSDNLYSYDASYQVNANTGELQLSSFRDYVYNENLNLSEYYHTFIPASSGDTTKSRFLHDYDVANGDDWVVRTQQKYEGGWINDAKIHNFWIQSSDFLNTELADIGIKWSQPNAGALTFSIANLEPYVYYRVSVINSLGMKVKYFTSDGETKIERRYSLAPGPYYIYIENQSGHQKVEKVIVGY